MIHRRAFLSRTVAVAGLALVAPVSGRAQLQRPRFTRNPFTLGVASGFPTADSLVLWTRLAPQPLAPQGGMDPVTVPVHWELALDAHFHRVLRTGIAYAEPEWAHSVHVEPPGLEPGRDYWYRFRVGDVYSPVGRSWTSTPATQSREQLRIAVASCQQYEQGQYSAYRQMVRDNPDLILHMGDYIYEQGSARKGPRSHESSECYTLEDYRARHALYRSDPALQAAHAHCPWLLTTDDHEVDNDYAGDISTEDDLPRQFLLRRAAAYRAYYEHLPLPRRAVPMGPDMRLYGSRSVGGLATIHLLDERQYRSPHACPRPGQRGANRVLADECPELFEPQRSMLGFSQERWLDASLSASTARWNLLAQGVVMAYVDEEPGPRHRYWTDGWNGYPAARERLLRSVAQREPRNPVVIGGDLHAFIASDIRLKPDDGASPIVTSELVTTSITSQGPAQSVIDSFRLAPDVAYAEGAHRGYLRVDLTAREMRTDLVAMDTVLTPDSAARVLRSFVVEDGRKGLQSG